MKHALVIAALLAPLLFSSASQAQTAWISDELTVPLRSGPSGGHRILHRGLPSGTKLEVLSVNETAGFSEIRTERGTEGWIRSQYLVAQPIAKLRLSAAQTDITQLRRELSQAQARIGELQSANREVNATREAGDERLAALQQEHATLQRISADAVTTHEENLRLQEANARLHQELDDLAAERDMLERNASNEGIMLGAGLVFLGLIAGVLIKARPQRSAWS